MPSSKSTTGPFSKGVSSGRVRTSTDPTLLPLDVFYHIFENLPQTSLTNVARTSSSLHEVSERLMYRKLQLTSIPQALQCFQTLMSKPVASQYVREFIIMINGARNRAADFGPRLSYALKSMTQLTALHLAIDGPYAPALEGCNFPRLTVFSSIVDLSPVWTPMAEFLNRHPTITELCVGGESSGQAFTLAPDALPALRAYMGSRRLAPAIIPTRPITRVTLAWHAPNVELEVNCVVPFVAMSSLTVQTFSCATPGWSSALIRAVATYLPKLRSIRFHNVSADYHNEVEVYATLSDVLASFTDLTRLEIPCNRSLRSIISQDTEPQFAKAWRSLAPHLSVVTFPSLRTWATMENGAWSLVQPAR